MAAEPKQRSDRSARPSLLRQTRENLEFATVLELFATMAQTQEGKTRVRELPLLDRETQALHFSDLQRLFAYLAVNDPLRFPSIPPADLFQRDPVTKPFDAPTLRDLRDLVVFWYRLLDDEKLAEMVPYHHTRGELKPLRERLETLFDRHGDWREDVTPAYGRLLRQFKQTDSRLDDQLQSLVRRYGECLNETIVFERGGRKVLAVKQAFKGRVRGILQDYSASGNTVYIEPDEVVDTQNRLRHLTREIEDELWRLRIELTHRILEHAILAETVAPVLSRLDMLQALARMARAARLTIVEPNTERRLDLHEARHPFLDEQFAPMRQRLLDAAEPDQRRMVTFGLQLNEDLRGLVISGANTGGKTVTLKTTGLMAWMANSGLPIPIEAGGAVPFYRTIYADIGDHQSLDHDLSTFASHLVAVNAMLQEPAGDVLVLLDEIGSGTDPREGSALSQAVMEQFVEQGFHIIVTTHQQILCTFALNHPHLDNGSMVFDPKRLKPTYRFRQGVPGRSHALDIATDAGLPTGVLSRARSLIDDGSVDIEQAVAQLQAQHKLLEKQQSRLRKEERRAARRAKEAREERDALTSQREAEKERIARRVDKKVAQAERELRDVLADIRRSKAVRSGVNQFAAKRSEINANFGSPKKLNDVQVEGSGMPRDQWQPGDRVFLKLFRKEGRLESFDHKKARVDVAGKTMTVDIDSLLHVARPDRTALAGKTKVVDSVESDGATVPLELKLLGYRVEDALVELDSTIDRALQRQTPFLRVIHGHGTGALKQAVRDHLNRHPARKAYDLVIDAENDGVTEIRFAG